MVADECDGTGSTANANSSSHHHETAQTTIRGGGLKTENLSAEEDQQRASALSCEDEYRSYQPRVDNYGIHHVHNASESMLRQTPSFMSPPVSYLPQLQLQKFSGHIKHHPKFVQVFKAFVQSQRYDYHRRLLYLQMYLDDEPFKLVQNCSAYPDKSVGCHQAWELLNSCNGNSFRSRNKIGDELVRSPPIEAACSFELNYLASKMNSCNCLFETIGRLAELDSPDMLRALLRRLPTCKRNFLSCRLTKKLLACLLRFRI